MDNSARLKMREGLMELKYYIPEDLLLLTTGDIMKLLLHHFKEANILHALCGIQRYWNVIEISAHADYKESFLKITIRWRHCATYLVAESELIAVFKVYGAKLDSEWEQFVRKFNHYGNVVNYYRVRENYDGYNIYNGVRCIWLKNVIKRPSQLLQDDRRLDVVYDRHIMQTLVNICDEDAYNVHDKHRTTTDMSDLDDVTEDTRINIENNAMCEYVLDDVTEDNGLKVENNAIYERVLYDIIEEGVNGENNIENNAIGEAVLDDVTEDKGIKDEDFFTD